LLSGCEPERGHHSISRDLRQIKKDTLRIMIASGVLGMEERRNRTLGLEYALLSTFAEETGIPTTFEMVSSSASMVAALECGRCDIAAGLFSVPFIRSNGLAATCSYSSSPMHYVEHRSDPWYGAYPRHGGFPAEIIEYITHPGPVVWSEAHHGSQHEVDSLTNASADELLRAIALGHVTKAAIPEMLFTAYGGYYPHLKISRNPIGEVEFAFAVRDRSNRLKGALDSWLGNADNWPTIDALISAYKDGSGLNGSFSHPHHKGSDRISSFDPGFKAAGDSMGWDWRLLAALAFKESRFDTSALSHRGAIGVMQLMPSTAAELGVDSIMGVNGPIMTAARYLRTLDRMFRRSVPDAHERVSFALASYNVGPGHVMDAQRIASDVGLDSSKWHANVERAILMKTHPEYYRSERVKFGYCNGHHVFLFVREVLHYYEHYKHVGFQ
jgi:membrane-bound lytic murein transglycosylase F